MAVRFSTGLDNAILDTASFKSAMNGFFIDLYTGVQPASADSAPGATLLRTYSVNGDGVTGGTWGSASNKILNRTSSEVMSGVAVANGVPGWARIRLASDDNSLSTTYKRIDVSAGVSGQDLAITASNIAVGDADILGVLGVSLGLSS